MDIVVSLLMRVNLIAFSESRIIKIDLWSMIVIIYNRSL